MYGLVTFQTLGNLRLPQTGRQWYAAGSEERAMYRPAPPARGKVVAAVTVSVLAHALIGLAWWASADRFAVAAPMLGTAVDAPDDKEAIFVLRDPPAERPKPPTTAITSPDAAKLPAKLAATVTGRGPQP